MGYSLIWYADIDGAANKDDETHRPLNALRIPERKIPAAPWREAHLELSFQRRRVYDVLTTDSTTDVADSDSNMRTNVQ